MASWFWFNVPLMVLAFALTTGLSYALLLGRRETATAAKTAPAAGAARVVSAYPAAA
jgi:hypothetical protein